MSDLPQGWVETCIDAIAEVNPGRLGDIAVDAQISFVPMLAVSDIDGEIFNPTIRSYGEVSKGYTQFREGDVIFAKITPCMENGKIAVARALEGGVACGSTEFHVVRPFGDISSDFLWRYLRQKSFRNDAEASMTGAVGQRRVPASFLKEHRLALPPLPEQKRIVARLDSLTSKSRRARDHIDHIPRLVEKYKRAILAAAFRGDLTREWRETNGLPSLKTVRLPELLAEPIRNGLSVRGSDTPPGVRALRLSALRGGKVDLTDVRFLPITDDQSARFVLRKGDVLISRGNGTKAFVGLAALVGTVEFSTIFPDTAFRLRPTPSIASPSWLALIWNAPPVREQIERAAKTTAGIWKISQGNLNEIDILLPDPDEQAEIVRRIESAFAWIDRLSADATSARKLVNHLDQAVLAKAFEGKLVPQDSADEPASALLDRLRAERAAPKAKRGRNKAA
ncbi:restriction endonuclease subunit S [Paraburkholderia megapolitana]|uniref:restriction endonuclease subunit S n=1 Tax=Paraburkholderia megapolitana TaxID=420953 RepID=UPI0038B92946